MASINNEFCFLMGLDGEGGIFFEIISDFKNEHINDMAEAMYAITSSLLNKEIVDHLKNQIKEHPTKKAAILKLIKKFNRLHSVKEAPPLIDALQVIHD